MFNASQVFVIIPAFNEQRVICSTIQPLIEHGYTVVVVDDCSRDNTWDILTTLPVIRIRHSINLGQGAALETGMEYARRHAAACVIHFDADGQHDWSQIPELLKPIEDGQAEVVFGSRFMKAEHAASVPKIKRLLLKGGIIISGLSSGVWLTDTHNGFRALSSRALHSIHIKQDGFAHATEILQQVRHARMPYREVATHIRYTDYSKAKGQSSWNAINLLVDLIVKRVFH
jgi:glycosyltransferase involved in cell wall biosynthesis